MSGERTVERQLRVNGVRLAYRETGMGEALVLVHGSWGSQHNWDRVIPGLAAHHRVVIYDRRGHSDGERPPGRGTFAADVVDLAVLIEALYASLAAVLDLIRAWEHARAAERFIGAPRAGRP